MLFFCNFLNLLLLLSLFLGSPAAMLVWAVAAYLVSCSLLHSTCILECSFELVCTYLGSATSPCAGPQNHTFHLYHIPLSHVTARERCSWHAHLFPATSMEVSYTKPCMTSTVPRHATHALLGEDTHGDTAPDWPHMSCLIPSSISPHCLQCYWLPLSRTVIFGVQ